MSTAATISSRQLEIIEAAGKILTREGVGGLTIKNLAKEMEFSESALYRHFTSKEEIIIALIEYLTANLNERVGTIVRHDIAADEKLTQLFKSQLEYFCANPHFVVAVFSDGLLDESERINEAIYNLMGTMMHHLLPVIIEGQEQGIFTSRIEADALLHIIMGTFRLEMYKWRITGFGFDIIEEGNSMISQVMLLVKKSSS